MSQKQKILDYISEHGSITPLDAMREFGIMRLAARVWDLTREGVPIVCDIEKSKNRDGETVTYARYRLSA